MRWEKKRLGPDRRYVNAVFRKFLAVLKDKNTSVYKVKDLRNPLDRRIKLNGLTNLTRKNGVDSFDFWLCPERKSVLQILVHELLHATFQNISEMTVRESEFLLLISLTEKQREVLEVYIPRKFSKKSPKNPMEECDSESGFEWDEKRAEKSARYVRKIFTGIISVLDKSHVYKVFDLSDLDDAIVRLSGFCERAGSAREYHRIYINEDTAEIELRSLIHECLHLLFAHWKHSVVESAEITLVKVFSSAQKVVLAEYIPKKISALRNGWDE